jgi:DNA-binding response OmpR family regulator
MSARILFADDDRWIAHMVTTVLEERGHMVEIAHDGEDALARSIAQPPDLLITDVMMPKMDGWTLVKLLRSRKEFTFMPVIFLTALISEDDRIQGFRLGADDYLPKPFRFEELDLRVNRTLKYRDQLELAARRSISQVPRLGSNADGARLERPGDGAAAVSGRLDQVGLSALLTLLEMERKSGILVVTQPTVDVGRVFLRAGRIVAARLDEQPEPINEECVYQLLRWSAGRFEFIETEVEMEDQIQVTTTHLLMEGARLIDEASRPGPPGPR